MENARRTPDRVVINRREGATWTPVTAAGFAAEVDRLALGFVAAGVAAGDRVGLMAKTRYEWTLVDVALWTVGAVTVPVYETSSAEQLRWILADSGAVGVVVETRGHAELLAGVAADLPDLRDTWTIEPVAGSPEPRRRGRGRRGPGPGRAHPAPRGHDPGHARHHHLHLRHHRPAQGL